MIPGIESRRNLDIHTPAQDYTGRRCGPCNVEGVRFGKALHPRARFCTEVLNDDFLDVSVLFVQLPDCDQTIDALLERLTDSDKNPGGKSDRKLTGFPNHPQP